MHKINGYFPLIRCTCGRVFVLYRAIACVCGMTVRFRRYPSARGKYQVYCFFPRDDDYERALRAGRIPVMLQWVSGDPILIPGGPVVPPVMEAAW